MKLRSVIATLLLLSTASVFGQKEEQAEALYEDVHVLINAKQYDKAAKLLKKITGMKMDVSHQVNYLVSLGTLYRDSLGNEKEALKYLEKAHGLEQKLSAEKDLDVDDFGNMIAAHSALSEVAESAKDYKRMQSMNECGLRFYDEVVKPQIPANNDDLSLDVMYCQLCTSLGKALGMQGNYDEAAKAFEKGVQAADAVISRPRGSRVFYVQKWMVRFLYSQMYSQAKGDKGKAYQVLRANVPEIERAIRINDEDLRKALDQQGPLFILQIANAAYEAGAYAECEQFCADALTWPNKQYNAAVQELREKAKQKL